MQGPREARFFIFRSRSRSRDFEVCVWKKSKCRRKLRFSPFESLSKIKVRVNEEFFLLPIISPLGALFPANSYFCQLSLFFWLRMCNLASFSEIMHGNAHAEGFTVVDHMFAFYRSFSGIWSGNLIESGHGKSGNLQELKSRIHHALPRMIVKARESLVKAIDKRGELDIWLCIKSCNSAML